MSATRVLFLIDCLGRGGAAQVVLNAALALDRTLFLPIVCVTRDGPLNGTDEILKEAGVMLIILERKSVKDFWAWKSLWDVLPSVSIIHSHESGSNFWARIWGFFFRVPVVITQDHTASDEKKAIVRFFDRISSSLSDRILTVSEYNREMCIRLEKIPPDKVMSIYNGIDLKKFSCNSNKILAREKVGIPKDKFILTVVARLVEQKNHKCLFESILILPEFIQKNIHCVIVGAGPYEEKLKRQVQILKLQERISFLGERLDIPTILKATDLFVLPSYSECLPIVILEAMASSCAIVSTAVGGIPEIIHTVGWPLVLPNDETALSEAILSVYQMSESEINHKIQSGKELVEEKFSKECLVSQLEAFYGTFNLS